MTGNARGSGRILGSLRSADGKGVVRMEDGFDTDIDDLWSALTDPRRLARWIGDFAGDLRPGDFRARFFASGWEGTGRGMPTEALADYGAGIQIHVEDLAAHIAGREPADAEARWAGLLPAYQDRAAQAG